MNWLLAHYGPNKKRTFDAVATGLKTLGHELHWICRNDMAERPELVAAIGSGDFDGLLTWQRFYGMQRDLLDAVAETSIRTVFMDFGFWPHYGSVVFDPEGENATSQLCRAWSDPVARCALQIDDAAVAAALQAHRKCAAAVRRSSLADHGITDLEASNRPMLLVVLQRCGDSVVRYDSRVHDFAAFVQRVLKLAVGRYFVVIKAHPMSRDVDLGISPHVRGRHVVIRRSNGVHNDRLCDFLLSRAALVVGINSSLLFRAMLFGKPVIAAGKGWYSGSGALREVDGTEGLHSLDAARIDVTARRRYLGACFARQLQFNELQNPEHLERVLTRIGIRLPHEDNSVSRYGHARTER